MLGVRARQTSTRPRKTKITCCPLGALAVRCVVPTLCLRLDVVGIPRGNAGSPPCIPVARGAERVFVYVPQVLRELSKEELVRMVEELSEQMQTAEQPPSA